MCGVWLRLEQRTCEHTAARLFVICESQIIQTFEASGWVWRQLYRVHPYYRHSHSGNTKFWSLSAALKQCEWEKVDIFTSRIASLVTRIWCCKSHVIWWCWYQININLHGSYAWELQAAAAASPPKLIKLIKMRRTRCVWEAAKTPNQRRWSWF